MFVHPAITESTFCLQTFISSPNFMFLNAATIILVCLIVVLILVNCSKSKIFKCQGTMRTSWNKKVEEKARNKNMKEYERNLKDAKKKMLEVILSFQVTQRFEFHVPCHCVMVLFVGMRE